MMKSEEKGLRKGGEGACSSYRPSWHQQIEGPFVLVFAGNTEGAGQPVRTTQRTFVLRRGVFEFLTAGEGRNTQALTKNLPVSHSPPPQQKTGRRPGSLAAGSLCVAPGL